MDLAYRNNVQAVKASKGKPAGPGKGRRRQSNAGDVSMGGENDEDDDDDDGGIEDDEGGEGDQSALMQVEGPDDDEEEIG